MPYEPFARIDASSQNWPVPCESDLDLLRIGFLVAFRYISLYIYSLTLAFKPISHWSLTLRASAWDNCFLHPIIRQIAGSKCTALVTYAEFLRPQVFSSHANQNNLQGLEAFLGRSASANTYQWHLDSNIRVAVNKSTSITDTLGLVQNS